jgi:predicted negative regulator of RcsB-dependent stress response
MSRQELRAPDAFQRAGLDVRAWISKHQALVIGLAVAVAVAWFGAAVVRMMSEKREGKASEAMGTAVGMLARPLVADLPPGTPLDPPPFKTAQERDLAATSALESVRSTYSGTRAALTATLALASAELRQGKVDTAIGHFEAYLREAPAGELLRVTALDGLGHAREAKQELPQALDAYLRMSTEEAGGFLEGMGSYHRARVLAAQGKKQEAAQAFADLISAHPGSAAARQAQERLSVLESEGFKAVVVPRPDAG